MDNHTDTSLSFLEPLHSIEEQTNAPSSYAPISPTVIDPAFLSCTLGIPKKIEAFYKNVGKINALYTIIDGDFIIIEHITTRKPNYNIFVDSYSTFSFPSAPPSHLIFIIGRRNYISSERHRKSRSFKNSVKNGTIFVDNDNISKFKMAYLKYQVKNKVNFVFIESSEELHRAIKNASTITGMDSYYVPKIKTFTKDSKEELMRQTLKQIAGVSDSIVRCICEKYKDFRSLRKALLDNPSEIRELVISDETKVNKRILGEKICGKLINAFTNDNKDERI